MATIKSFTDLEQSKRLAEILPLESADSHYVRNTHDFMGNLIDCKWSHPKYGNPNSKYAHYVIQNFSNYEIIPCWSLAALIGVMPQINEWITPHGHKNDKLFQSEPKICKIWEHSIIPSYKVTYDNGLFTDIYDNPVDACVAMIIKLCELKML